MVAMPRKMVTVSGCCCFSLITGSKILGWLGMLVSFSSIVITVSLLLSDTDQIMEELFEEYKHYYEIQEMLEYYYNHKSCEIAQIANNRFGPLVISFVCFSTSINADCDDCYSFTELDSLLFTRYWST